MPGKTARSSNLELLRILCMLLIIGDHLTGQGGAQHPNLKWRKVRRR